MSESKKQGDEFIHIKELFGLLLCHWYWFVLSVVICLTVAVTYIAITPSTYTRTASILVKNSNSRGAPSSAMEPLSDMGLFKTNTDVKSEVYVLKSPTIMKEVVNRLKLDYNYSVKYRNIRFVDLYNATPVIVKLDSTLGGAFFNFTIKLLPDQTVSLSDFNINGIESDSTITGGLSAAIKTPYGAITVTPTAAYSSRSVGRLIYFSKQNPNLVAEAYSNKLDVTIDKDDVPIILFSFVDVSAQRAEDILSTLISVYNENWIKDKNQITSSTSDFIGERLHVIETELGSVDNNISDYKSENLIPDVNAVSGMYLSQFSNNASKMAIVQNQLSMARYIRTYMVDATYKNQLLPANTGIDNGAIENQIDKYNTILLQKNNLIANSSEQNPVLADMVKSLNSMKEVIIRSIDDYISTLNIQLDNIRHDEKVTNRKIASNPNQARYLLSVERQQKVKEALYLFLLQKREENELTQTFTAYNTKIVNPPAGSIDSTAPRKKLIFIAAFVIGLVIPALILFVKESLNTLVRDKSDLEGLNIPFIGEIPFLNRKRRVAVLKRQADSNAKVMIVVEDKNRNMINEAFRNIRTNIDFMRPKSDIGTVIMTTSFNPGSGKTFTTINTALSMVLKGSRTIVIDVDLRKTTLSSIVNTPQTGLSNYLNGTVDNWKSLVVKEAVNDMLDIDIMPVGKIPPNPSELLIGERFLSLINKLKFEYDYVFLDCPPVSMIADSSIIGHVADLTLFIIRANLLDKRSLPEVERIHLDGHIKNMAIVLNGLDFVSARYGYGRYGYGRYGYGKYGYGYDEQTSPDSKA